MAWPTTLKPPSVHTISETVYDNGNSHCRAMKARRLTSNRRARRTAIRRIFIEHNVHYAKSSKVVGKDGRRLQGRPAPHQITGESFAVARQECRLSVLECAQLLRVTERTVRNWENGATTVPFMAFKLLRVLKGGKFLGPEWHGWMVNRDTLYTPEGHSLKSHEMAWWSLLIRQAREFQTIMRTRRHAAAVAADASAAADAAAALTLDQLQAQVRERLAQVHEAAKAAQETAQAVQAAFDGTGTLSLGQLQAQILSRTALDSRPAAISSSATSAPLVPKAEAATVEFKSTSREATDVGRQADATMGLGRPSCLGDKGAVHPILDPVTPPDDDIGQQQAVAVRS